MTEEGQPTLQAEVPKKVYEKPRVVYQGSLEAAAAICQPSFNGKGVPSLCLILAS